jgi:Cu(I)/Ag(I) efflux system periplasmic protein CusF
MTLTGSKNLPDHRSINSMETRMKHNLIAAIFVGALLPLPALAVEAHHQPTAAAAAGAPLSDGEVRKVDKDAKKITIRHGPIVNLDMPAMTMVFQVKDPAMLDQVKAGDKIRFAADKAGGAYTVTQIEIAK